MLSVDAAVLRQQILLDRAHFSPGEIDARNGENTRIAIEGYRQSRTQPLNDDQVPALVPYTITDADVSGPFDPIPTDMMEKSKLKSLGYESAAEALGEKFHVDPKLLARLNPGKDLSKAGEELTVPNVTRESAIAQADRIVVSETRKVVEARAADGTLLAQYPATIGSEHDPLPIGEWKVTVVQRNPIFNYNPDLFWDADPEHSQAKIPAGPNNPVGVVWIGLSKEHYGIHGTPEPGTVGHTQSHGCIRLTNWDAIELSRRVRVGTRVTLQEP